MNESLQLRAELNDFAFRCFRDVADEDYIAARTAYRQRMSVTFLWSGQQALEKYLKCILLLNRVDSRSVGHDLEKALTLVDQEVSYEIRRSESTDRVIQIFDDFGQRRYLEAGFYIRGRELMWLDKAVWELRRYCRVLDYCLGGKEGGKSMLSIELSKNMEAEKRPPHDFRIHGGFLERILNNYEHPARPSLVWHNLRFGKRRRKKVKPREYFYSLNAPLTLRPELIHEVEKFVHLPSEVKKVFKKAAAENKKNPA